MAEPVYCFVDAQEILEDIELYRPGGFHPIMPGDFLGPNNRFDVWNKLGQGAFGIVWLCFDTAKEKFCAVKVLRADYSSNNHMLQEMGHSGMLQNVSLQEAWENHVVLPLESFFVHGPNGKHLCTVMPLLGPDILDARIRHSDDVPFLKDICYQLTKGLTFLHKHGVGHGDIRNHNVLFKTMLDDLTPDEMNAYMPAPIGREIHKLNGESCDNPHAPTHAIEPMDLSLEDRYITRDIAIVDLGVCFDLNSPPMRSSIPESWAAPENQPPMHARPGMGSDLWALGCTIASVLCGSTPFAPGNVFSWEVLEEALGPIPEPYRAVLIKNKAPGIQQYAQPFPMPLMVPAHVLERCKVERLEKNGIDDFLHDIISQEEEYVHPDWDYETETLRPRLGKGWATPAHVDANLQEHTEYGCKDELHDSIDDEERPMALPIGITRQLDPAAVPGAVDLLKQLLRWHPEDRVPAEQLLDHEWFEGRNKKITMETDEQYKPMISLPKGDSGYASLFESEHTPEDMDSADSASPMEQATHEQVDLLGSEFVGKALIRSGIKSSHNTIHEEILTQVKFNLDEKSVDDNGLHLIKISMDQEDRDELRCCEMRRRKLHIDVVVVSVFVGVGVLGRVVRGFCGIDMSIVDKVWQAARRMLRL